MSRFRHWFTRTLGWFIRGLAFTMAVSLLILTFCLLFFDYHSHLESWMEAQASEILGRDVSIGSFSVNLPNRFELRDFKAEPSEPGAPWLEFESLRGEINLSRILQREIELSLLQMEGLIIRIQDYGGGRVDLPGLWRTGATVGRLAPEASFALGADRILLEDASILYNNWSIPWRLEARELSLRLDREGPRYAGAIEYQQGELRIKDRPPATGSVHAEVEIYGRELRVVELVSEGPFYTLQSRGTISVGKEPRADMTLQIESQVGPAARTLLGVSQLTGTGPATFLGGLTMGRGWHELTGQVDIPEARLAGLPLRNWKGEILWSRSGFSLTSMRGEIAGGVLIGNLEQPLPPAGKLGHLDAQIESVELQTLFKALYGVPGPLTSRVSGQAHFDGLLSDPYRASGRFELSGEAAESSDEKNGLVLLTSGVFESGNLTLGPSRFETDFATVRLSGDYPRNGPANLLLDLESRDLARVDMVQQELRTLLHSDRPPRRLEVAGTGGGSGRLTGRFPRMEFDGEFKGSHVGFRDIDLGNVNAQGSLSTDAVHFRSLTARRNGASLSGRGELAFGSTPLADWALTGKVTGWPAEALSALLSMPDWLAGELSGQGSFHCRDSQMDGEGTFQVEPGSLLDRSFDRAEGRLKLAGRQIALESVSASRGPGRAEGHLRYDLDTGQLEGQFTAERLPVSDLGAGAWRAGGHWDARLRLEGTWRTPSIELEASSPVLEIGAQSLGATELEAVVRDGIADGKLRIKGEKLELEAQSRIQLSPGFPVTGHARWQGIDLGSWIRSMVTGTPDSLELLTDGESDFQGDLFSPEALSAELMMKRVQLNVGDYQLASSAPVKVRVRNRAIEIGELQLNGEGTELELVGRLPLGPEALDVEARGSVNMGLVESLFPSVSSGGGVDVSARITGSWMHPSLSGHAEVRSGTLRFEGFPQALGDIHGKVVFDNRTVHVPDLQARFGGAPVTVSGTMVLHGLNIDSVELKVEGSEIRLRYPEGLAATLDVDLSFAGTSRSQVLSGYVEVAEATWSREYDLATGILVSGGPDALEILEEVVGESPFSNLRFDIDIRAPGTIRVRNSRASVEARAELQLRGTFARPALLGRSEALRGEVFLLGQRYRLLSGRVEFVDPTAVKPFFDLVAESRVRSYRIELRLSGTPERFFPELSSDPPLRTMDILRLLAGASERGILSGSEEEEVAGVGVASLLTERLTQEVGRRAERLFGLDRFSIDPFLVGQFANPTARVSIGKQIYRDLSVSYSGNLNSTTETLILIEYTPQGPISWIISRDEDGALGVDLRFRKSF